MFWMLYVFLWVIPRRLNFICQRFRTLCLFHLHRRVGTKNDWEENVGLFWSERENQQDATVRCLLSTLSQHVSGIIMPIFSRTRRVLLHVVCSALTSGEKVDISCNDFFVGYCVVNLDGTSCLYANVVWKWVCLGAWLVSASCVIHVLCIGNRCTDACVVPFWWEGCVVQVLLGALGGVCRWWAGWYRGWRFNVKSATYLVLLDVVGSGCGALRCRVHLITPAPHTPPIKQAQRMHQNTRSRYTRPETRTRQIPVQRYDTPIYTRHSHIHTRGPK